MRKSCQNCRNLPVIHLDDLKSARKILRVTLQNYIHMKKRLISKSEFSKFVLTYYSIFLIILGISGKYLDGYNDNLSNYTSILLSIVLLAYSIVNGNSEYEIRIYKLEKTINDLKLLSRKKEISEAEFVKSYDIVVNATEMREDIDFINTVKSMYRKKEENIFKFIFGLKVKNENEDLKRYRADINIFSYFINVIFLYGIRLIILGIPIVLLLWILSTGDNTPQHYKIIIKYLEA